MVKQHTWVGINIPKNEYVTKIIITAKDYPDEQLS